MKFAILRPFTGTGTPALIIKHTEDLYSMPFLSVSKDLFIQNKLRDNTFTGYTKCKVEEYFDLTNVEFLTREELLILESDKF